MRWEEWKFSARRAAQDSFVRWTTVSTVVLLVGMSSYLLVRVLPVAWRSGVVTMHYTIYLGIDDVRPWPWIFFVPGVAIFFGLLDLLIAFGIYLRDALASRTLVALALITAILWTVGSFFLLRVNV